MKPRCDRDFTTVMFFPPLRERYAERTKRRRQLMLAVTLKGVGRTGRPRLSVAPVPLPVWSDPRADLPEHGGSCEA